jgi:hypothetical protein
MSKAGSFMSKAGSFMSKVGSFMSKSGFACLIQKASDIELNIKQDTRRRQLWERKGLHCLIEKPFRSLLAC